MTERCRCAECETPDWEVWTLTYEEGLEALAVCNLNTGDSMEFYGMMDTLCAHWGLPTAVVLQDMDDRSNACEF